MKKLFVKIASFLLCIALSASLFSGCSKTQKINFVYPFSADVNSYDPQVAATADEYLIIENTFEGLVRVDDDGTVKPAVAESWSISANKLVYTFNIQKGLKWNIDTELDDNGKRREDERLEYMGYDFNPDITAHDFVFALQRAASKTTDCPLFPTISCIKNANAIHSGKKDKSTLGVKAINDYQLQITLSTRDDSFIQTLATAVAMPCNEQFFKATKGRYGLDTKFTLFNGQFYVSRILDKSYLLKVNKQYAGCAPSSANQLILSIVDEETDTVKNLESGYFDAAFISGADSDKLKKSSGITYVPYNDTTWAFVFNTNNDFLSSKKLRKALCLGFNRLDNIGKEYLSNATNLTPTACMIGANSATKAMGKTAIKQDIEQSIDLWRQGMNTAPSNNIELTILTTEDMEYYVKKMLQGVQSGIGTVVTDNLGNNISFTMKVEAMAKNDIDTAIAKGEYDIVFYPFKSSASSALTYLKSFADNSINGLDTTDLKSYIKKAQKATDLKTAASYTKKAEKSIINSYSICPMLYETSYYAAADGVKNIQFHAGTGRVSFVNATREE